MLNPFEPNKLLQLDRCSSHRLSTAASKSKILQKDDINAFYKIGKEIGSGRYGVVKLAKRRFFQYKKFAVKQIAVDSVSYDKVSIERELDILMKIDHPNLIRLFEIFEDEHHYHIVTELCKGGELYD